MARAILVVDDEANMRTVLAAMLKSQGYDVMLAANGLDALAIIEKKIPDLIITDLKMPEMDGLALLERVSQKFRDEIPVVMLTAHGSIDSAVEAMKLGAFNYIEKPFEQEEIHSVVATALNQRERNRDDVRVHRQEIGSFQVVGQSPKMLEIYRVIDKVADSPATVLITGESGTGKELIARILHEKSRRVAQPFLKVNCAAIPTNLIESELFGYEKGAFTGAFARKPGRFEIAHGGTLFLDEIGEISKEMQAKLLRVIQERQFERVGGVKTIEVNVRLIAATNRNLSQEVQNGNFREDLYYRLNVIPIHLPTLRERPEDLTLLVHHCIRKFQEILAIASAGITPEALRALGSYAWPGNIRELENIIERALLMKESHDITLADLPPELRPGPPPTASSVTHPAEPEIRAAAAVPTDSLKDRVKLATSQVEKEIILEALTKTGGNVTWAARHLKISRKSLQLKMKEFGLRANPTPDEPFSAQSTTRART